MNAVKNLYSQNVFIKYSVNAISILVALMLFGMALFELALTSCYDAGGFCAKEFNPEGIYRSAIWVAFTGLFLTFPFKRSLKALFVSVLLTSLLGLLVALVSYILIAP